MVAPNRCAACARPLTSFPGSAVPPGTSFTTPRVPESFHEMGESFFIFLRPNSQTPGKLKSHSILNTCRISAKPSSTSPRPGKSPAADSARVIPPVCPLEPAPTQSASNTAVVLSGSSCLSLAAADKPLKPPPTMAKSTSDGKARAAERKSIVHGGLPQPALLGECLLPDCNTNPLFVRKLETDVPHMNCHARPDLDD